MAAITPETTKSSCESIEIVAPAPYEWFEKWNDETWGKRGEDYEALKKDNKLLLEWNLHGRNARGDDVEEPNNGLSPQGNINLEARFNIGAHSTSVAVPGNVPLNVGNGDDDDDDSDMTEELLTPVKSIRAKKSESPEY